MQGGGMERQEARRKVSLHAIGCNASATRCPCCLVCGTLQSVGAPAVRAALDGVNATVMCYGQTGAGKTHTMTGPRRSYCERGLVPRCISAVLAGLRGTDVGHSSFGDREGAGDTSSPPWTLKLSYLEVYGEALFDLLDPASGPGELGITDDDAGRVQVCCGRRGEGGQKV
jgi:kinesin family member 6/9